MGPIGQNDPNPGRDIERGWYVVLEAAASVETPALAPDALDRLEQALQRHLPLISRGERRYSVQLQVEAAGEAEALFSAVARWRDAARTVGLPGWNLARAEVLTVEEFERASGVLDSQRPAGGASTDSPRDNLADKLTDELADDLLARALQDSLTGLVNRELFVDRLRWALADGASGDVWTVLVFDLDHFAEFNRSEGPAAGDHVLTVLASRISHNADYTLAARLGGDEFAVLVREETAEDAAQLASRLLDSIRAPIDLGGRTVAVSASVGGAGSADMSYPDDLIRDATIAMCAAKADGGDCFRRYDAAAADVDVRRLEFDADPAPDRLANVLLLERAARAANACQTLDEAGSIVLQQVCTHTGWPLGHLSLASNTGEWVEPTAIWHVAGPDHFKEFRAACNAGSLSAGQGVAGRALATADFAFIADITRATDVPAPIASAAAQAGIKSAAAFPIMVGTEVVAFLEFYCTGMRRIYESLREVMGGVCFQLGRVAERNRAQAALARSEQNYRTLADSVPVLIWMSGLDGNCTMFNSAWLEFTGRTVEQEIGDGWVTGVHPDDVEQCVATYLDAFARQQPFEMDYRLRRADGQYRIIFDRGNPIGAGDDFQGYVGGCIDVTDRRHAEAALRDSEARLRALLATSGAMIILIDADGTVIADYQGTSAGLGYPEGSTSGRLGFEFVHPDDLARTADAFAAALSKPGLSEPFRCRVRDSDGAWRWIEAIGNNMLHYPPVGAIIISAVDLGNRGAVEELAVGDSRGRALAGAMVGLWQVDITTGTPSWSDEIFAIFGVPRSRGPLSLGELISTVVHPDDRNQFALVTGCHEVGQPAPTSVTEYRIVTPEGQTRRVRSRSMLVGDAVGRPIAVSGSIEDITDSEGRSGPA